MSCKVKTNRHGFLAFRLYWNNRESWEGTGLKDTPKNRQRMEARAVLIAEEIERGEFDYLRWFPDGNKAAEFKPAEPEPAPAGKTVGEYYREWIKSKKPPAVRAGQERDYREHFARYILPQFENLALTDVTPRRLLDLRIHLTDERGLKLKTAKTIIDASFRACIRDARKVDGLVEGDPFAALNWPRLPVLRPDPFTAEERDDVLALFQKKAPFYFPFVHTLFFTGARPSELLALRWGDVDLKAGFISITKSRYLDENATKTAGSDREVRLMPGVAEVLENLKPLHVTEADHVFLNQEGHLLNFHTWRSGVWYRLLRSSKVRPRKPYACRHTFISVGLSNGVNIKWLADYAGTSISMIEKHYGKYVNSDIDEQFSRLLGTKTETFTETFSDTPPKYLKRLVGPPGLEPGTNRL
jgi:integrase